MGKPNPIHRLSAFFCRIDQWLAPRQLEYESWWSSSEDTSAGKKRNSEFGFDSKIEEGFSCRKWTESLNSRLVIQGCWTSFHMIKAAIATKESSQPSWWTFLPHTCRPLPHHDPSPATHSECGYGRPQRLSSQKLTLVIVDIQSTQFAPTSCFHTKKSRQIIRSSVLAHFSLGKWPQTPLFSGRNQMTAMYRFLTAQPPQLHLRGSILQKSPRPEVSADEHKLMSEAQKLTFSPVGTPT